MSAPDPQDRFSEAKEMFLLAAIQHAKGEAAMKVAVAMTTFASRSDFDATGALVAWPSMRTLAELTGIFRSRIDRGIKSLEASGLVTVERPEKRGATHHNRYILAAQNGRTGADNEHGPNGRTSVANSKSENGRTGADNEQASNGRTHADAKSAPVGPKYIIPTGADPAGGGAVTRDPASPDADEGIIDSSDEHSDASAGARERARSGDVQGADHPASDPEAASFVFDLVPEHAPADGVVPLPIPRRGQHITLAERDALAEGWLRAEGPLADEADDEDAEAEEQDDREYAAVIQAAAELRRLHGWSTGDAETLVFEAVRGCVYGARESAQLAGDMACRAMSGLQDEAAAQAWRRHLAVMRAVFVVHAGDKKAEAVVARYARRYEAAKGMAAQVQAEAGKEVSHG
ncbi:hypothetical protein [Cereibacter azotoformans]|uniref:hypothetical protein n=1 Tax=Cereibacter azotoformans TaxID=43057 RepID=UPI000C6EA937|nr:hypothetical protein [Cereibacter azotoformans]